MNKDNIKTIFKYVFLFIIFLFWNLYIQELNYDEIWNYGFSYNIARGLVPYRDFNMVVTPLYSFLCALPMLIFGHNIVVLHVTNVFLMLGVFYLLEKLCKERVYFFYALILMTVKIVSPSYNLLLLLFFLLLIYLEKNKKNDYLIGLIIALSCLTKQSVGVLFILPSLLLIKDKEKLKKRFIAFIIPCLIFLVYLIFTKSFMQFLDLCLFGLFDFGKENTRLFNPFFYSAIIMFIINIYLIIKDKKNIYNYYTFGFLFVAVPLFDGFHTTLAAFGLIILLYLNGYLEKIKLKDKMVFYGTYIGVGLSLVLNRDSIVFPNGIHNFEYRYVNTPFINFIKKVDIYMKENDNYEYIVIGEEGYLFKIMNEKDITYLDLFNRGNHGYNGSEKLKQRVIEKASSPNVLVFINKKEFNDVTQTDNKVLRYIYEHSMEVDNLGIYGLYKYMGDDYINKSK